VACGCLGLLGFLYLHSSILTPLVPARKALRLMNTKYSAAFGTGPPFLFVSDEMSYAEFLYVYKIVNHAHSILGSIALIQVSQPVARKAVTTEAVLGPTLCYLLAVLDPAGDTAFRFDAVVSSAAKAYLLISCVCATKAAVHSAWGDQRRSQRNCLFRPSWCHVRIPGKVCIVIPF
jgi:hypothetical protein